MRNSSRQLYQKFLGQGMSKDAAFFAVLDHFNELHWHDRDRVTEENKRLKERLDRLEKDEA